MMHIAHGLLGQHSVLGEFQILIKTPKVEEHASDVLNIFFMKIYLWILTFLQLRFHETYFKNL